MAEIEFKCPNCSDECPEKIDNRFITSERVQNSDDLNADPATEEIEGRIELWYCCICGQYFRVYYKLDKITPLTEGEPK